jgi:predicted dehydrogenase
MIGARHGPRLHWANYASLPEGLVELPGVCARTRASAESFARDAKVGFVTDGVVKVNMTQNDAVETFAPDPNVFGDERFPERLETRAGWNHPSCDEDWFRGSSQELADFVAAIRAGRRPLSGIQLAVDCVDVVYAAYVSAEEGRRVLLGGDVERSPGRKCE